jgi:hypothetical protein
LRSKERDSRRSKISKLTTQWNKFEDEPVDRNGHGGKEGQSLQMEEDDDPSAENGRVGRRLLLRHRGQFRKKNSSGGTMSFRQAVTTILTGQKIRDEITGRLKGRLLLFCDLPPDLIGDLARQLGWSVSITGSTDSVLGSMIGGGEGGGRMASKTSSNNMALPQKQASGEGGRGVSIDLAPKEEKAEGRVAKWHETNIFFL